MWIFPGSFDVYIVNYDDADFNTDDKADLFLRATDDYVPEVEQNPVVNRHGVPPAA